MPELLTCVALHQVNKVQGIPTDTEQLFCMAEVLHIPVQHPASGGLVRERLVIPGLREDRGLETAGW